MRSRYLLHQYFVQVQFAAPSPAPTDSMSYIIPYRLSLNINKMNICNT
ncbi:hypothetical protein ECEC1735_5496 [Escherichia coli EC1735]|nr:hypothetical protein ECFRIK1990_5644 [Escherichia coli FRIK1990]EIN55796.1 hypothetical protein ECPA9_5661 [Escherichia coli PA9]EIN69950.1 hypothetical protein ECPA14_5616 [Escherichia coli PA14]EIP50131.1 hypothetical protein ECEC4448_5517 [Escherichia coli EC4448]EKH32780.1 hypothetical protein ECFRIK1997_5767 [Escherichia coli FRIK1997]EKI46781.1 hypothetical protein ECEC1735_5496 [Escherichia coli EC1735]EKK62328.1 hypothetical protein EC100869_5339 [Escherichia coli 10.0869]EKW27060